MKKLFFISFIFLVGVLSACSKGGDSGQIPAPTTSKVVFTNNTYTQVKLVFDGQNYTLAAGESLPFVESPNANLAYSATTGGGFGYTIDFGSHNVISSAAGETSNISLAIPNSYFYLIINNSSASYTVRRIEYTYSLVSSNKPIIPNDGKDYGMGYYLSANLTSIIIKDQDCFSDAGCAAVNAHYWGFGSGQTTPLPTLSSGNNQKMTLNLK